MRIHRIWLPVVLVLVAQMLGTGCILFPQIEDRIVELAVGSSTTATIEADGILNVHNDKDTVYVMTDIDLAGVLDDAGIDVTDVKAISVSGASYRVTRADPTAGREIQNGNVKVAIGGAPEVNLVDSFAATADAVTPWQTATLDPAGVAQINALLAAILANLQGTGPTPDDEVIYHVTGDSVPGGVATDFQYQIKLDVSIVGEVKVKVVE